MTIKFKKGSHTYDVANRIRDYLLEDGLDAYSNISNELQKDIEIDVDVWELKEDKEKTK